MEWPAWITKIALWAVRLMARAKGGDESAIIKAGPFAKVNVTNNMTARDVTLISGSPPPKPIDDDAIVAKHLFFEKKLIVGTKAGTMEIPLKGKVYDLQIETVDAVLIAFQKNGILAPIDPLLLEALRRQGRNVLPLLNEKEADNQS